MANMPSTMKDPQLRSGTWDGMRNAARDWEVST